MKPDPESSVNEVTLRGRVSAAPEERELPSGDRIMVFRLVVGRHGATRGRTRQVVDVIECVAWTSRLRERVRRLRLDDRVEVTGALRRRFVRVGGAPSSFVSVELATCSVVRRTRR